MNQLASDIAILDAAWKLGQAPLRNSPLPSTQQASARRSPPRGYQFDCLIFRPELWYGGLMVLSRTGERQAHPVALAKRPML